MANLQRDGSLTISRINININKVSIAFGIILMIFATTLTISPSYAKLPAVGDIITVHWVDGEGQTEATGTVTDLDDNFLCLSCTQGCFEPYKPPRDISIGLRWITYIDWKK